MHEVNEPSGTNVSTRLLIPLLWITVRKIPAWKFPAWKIPVMKGDLENHAMSSKKFVFDVIVLKMSSASTSVKHVDKIYGFDVLEYLIFKNILFV